MVTTLPGYFTVQEAAPLLEVSEAQVTRYCHARKLEAAFVGGHWFIKRASVRKFKKPKRGNPNWNKAYEEKLAGRKK